MGTVLRRRHLVFLALTVAGCAPAPPPSPVSALPPTSTAVESLPTSPVEATVAPAVADVTLKIQEVAEAILPEPAPPRAVVHPDVVAMLAGLEIISTAYYNKRLMAPIWPGGRSGLTFCIGADLGYQSPATIATEWAEHPYVLRLQTAAGVTGAPARALVPRFSDVRTPYIMCEAVFAMSTLPRYDDAARRFFRDGWDALPFLVQGVLTSVGYNRGWNTMGDRRSEIRELRDDCVPRRDLVCIETQILSMDRIWNDPVASPPNLRNGLVRAYHARAAMVRRAIIEEAGTQ